MSFRDPAASFRFPVLSSAPLAGPAFAGFAELITLSTLDVYGKPSEELLELLRRKVQMLGDATVTVLQAGFARI
jgi:hypothetical protein